MFLQLLVGNVAKYCSIKPVQISFHWLYITGDTELKLFLDALQEILKDEQFKLRSPLASDVLEAATTILKWNECSGNAARVASFSKALVRHLNNCLPAKPDREKLWRNFQTFRISKDHFMLWNNFLKESIKSVNKGSAIFLQYVTTHIYKQLINKQFATPAIVHQKTACTLSYEEKNALRYAAGYIPRNLMSKLKRSACHNKESLSMCLLDIIEEDCMGDDESQDWVKLVNRGGLNYINNDMFIFVSEMLFPSWARWETLDKTFLDSILCLCYFSWCCCCLLLFFFVFFLFVCFSYSFYRHGWNFNLTCFKKMELVVKAFLEGEGKPRDIKSEMIKLIRDSDTAEWSKIAAEWEPEESQLIFGMVTDLWITMRGFSYASEWMEKWKQENKKSVQKSQALRKKLNKS